MPRLVTTLALALGLGATTAPADETVRLPVTRDAWFSHVGREADGSNGGSPRLKLKTYQEMSVVDVDPAPLRGRVVKSAVLRLKSASPDRLGRVTVGTVAAPWVEGHATNYEPEPGASTFRSRVHPDTPWTPDGGDFCSVILGQGGTTWASADASTPDAQGWQTVPVDPAVLALRAAGISQGFLLFDDTGTEWTRSGETFTRRMMPNRFVYSRDQNTASAPYFEAVLGDVDREPPAAPAEVTASADGLPAGQATVSWLTPADTVGFVVEADGGPLPQSMVPLAGRVGDRVTLRLRDLKFQGGSQVSLAVRAVDGAGNVGPPALKNVRLSARQPAPLPRRPVEIPRGGSVDAPVRLGSSDVWVVDELDKAQAVDGRLIPPAPPGYLGGNHLWDRAGRMIRLSAARNEFTAFQVMIAGRDRGLKASFAFHGTGAPRVVAGFGRYLPVASAAGPIPDPIVPLGGPEDPGGPADGETRQSLHVEFYVPHDAPAGAFDGVLTIESETAKLDLPLRLTVWNFTLPDRLGFIAEMNCYGLPDNERDYYRLAHAHRTVLNRVPYSQAGKVADGCAPAIAGDAFDWSAYDRRFGPLLDGSAFADLPRAGVPVDVFYLPLHENWPTPIEPNYNGDYWADRAFTPAYRSSFVNASRRFAEHIKKRGWDDTIFQCFFNGKNDFKANGWSRGSSPWLLDEPAHFQDFWALRYFGEAFHEGVKLAGGPGKSRLAFRADVSRPEWQRDTLDGLLDYNVVGGAMRRYARVVLDRKDRENQVVVEYGSANPVEESNMQAVGWSLDAWTLGVDGVLPWQTVSRGDSWDKADPLALFYPGRRGKLPVPSVRLKAFRRGQQDVEYLNLLVKATGEPRWAVAFRVREALKLRGERGGSGLAAAEDAGLVRYDRLRPENAWALREQIGHALSDLHPAPARATHEFRTPPRDPSRLRPLTVTVTRTGNRL